MSSTCAVSRFVASFPYSAVITKNGYGDLVIMSIETYEAMTETAAIDTAISEAEAEFEQNGQLFDASNALAAIRRKHFG